MVRDLVAAIIPPDDLERAHQADGALFLVDHRLAGLALPPGGHVLRLA